MLVQSAFLKIENLFETDFILNKNIYILENKRTKQVWLLLVKSLRHIALLEKNYTVPFDRRYSMIFLSYSHFKIVVIKVQKRTFIAINTIFIRILVVYAINSKLHSNYRSATCSALSCVLYTYKKVKRAAVWRKHSSNNSVKRRRSSEQNSKNSRARRNLDLRSEENSSCSRNIDRKISEKTRDITARRDNDLFVLASAQSHQ